MASTQNNSGKEAKMSYDRIGLMISENVTVAIGSWIFVISQSCVLFAWILFNTYYSHEFNLHSFIILNIILSFQAACTGSILLMTINHQANLDRRRDIENLRLQKRIYEVVLMLDAQIAKSSKV
jgi:uncharacterized membrane protein